ncbi:MAG: RrF2 family transcriptional regulator [Acutalibacteraceae bacterium]|jgi:Rrf2 family protein
MHITLESDYAVRIVERLAAADGRRGAAALAEEARVPPRFALKIMRKLTAAGIVTSFKGAHGGYTLARPADQITMRQVIEAMEGPYRLSRCLEDGYTCSCAPGICSFHAVYDRISRMVADELDKVHF